MAGLIRGHRGQLGANIRAVDAGAAECVVRVIARLRCDRHGLHSISLRLLWLGLEVHLKRAAQELLVTKELQELGVVLRPATDKIDGFAARCAIFDILAAVVETALVLLRPDIVQLGDKVVSGGPLFGLSDVDEQRLVG